MERTKVYSIVYDTLMEMADDQLSDAESAEITSKILDRLEDEYPYELTNDDEDESLQDMNE